MDHEIVTYKDFVCKVTRILRCPDCGGPMSDLQVLTGYSSIRRGPGAFCMVRNESGDHYRVKCSNCGKTSRVLNEQIISTIKRKLQEEAEMTIDFTKSKIQDDDVLTGKVDVYAVNFLNDSTKKPYYYKALKELSFKYGEMVVVETRGNNGGYGIAYIVSKCTLEQISEAPVKVCSFVVGSVDSGLQAIEAYKSKLKQKEALQKKIEAKFEERSKMAILEQMAKDDPELSALLEQFKSL